MIQPLGSIVQVKLWLFFCTFEFELMMTNIFKRLVLTVTILISTFAIASVREVGSPADSTPYKSRIYYLFFPLETPLETKQPKGGLDCPN